MQPKNPNWKETKDGWVKQDHSQTQGRAIDWDRLKREQAWLEQIRREREERNKAKPR